MKKLISIQTYGSNNMTSTGHTWDLYSDGHVTAESKTRCKGSFDGARWTTEPGTIDLADIDPDDPDNDLEAALTGVIDKFEDAPSFFPTWFRKTRLGTRVA